MKVRRRVAPSAQPQYPRLLWAILLVDAAQAVVLVVLVLLVVGQ